MQETLTQDQLVAKNPGWEASLNNNMSYYRAYIKTFAMSSVVGGGGRIATIQLEDAAGNPVASSEYLRVRISPNNSITNSGSASIAVSGDTSLISSFTADKDIVVKGNNAGTFAVVVTGPAGTYTLNIGPSDVFPVFGNYHNYLQIVL